MKQIYKLIFGVGLLCSLLVGCNSKGNNPSGENGSGSEEASTPTDDFPNFSPDGKTATYGYYPQTVVDDESVISDLNELKAPTSKGWYLYKGNYYVKINANPFNNGIHFDNGELIESGKQYWFKCEQINWKVATIKNGQYLIVTEKLLDVCSFFGSQDNRTIGGKTIYPNNYEHSDIRTWLNNDFYDSAFRLNDSYIQTTNVDNSASTTRYNTNTYCCNNTSDKIFLLNFKDYQSEDYGFGHDVKRSAKTTDWARARHAYSETSSVTFRNCSPYWTRSPYNESGLYTSYVNYSGTNDNIAKTNMTYYCARPALNIKIA